MPYHTAGCLCQSVRITAVGDPKRVGICHCLSCRKHHGAPFYAAAIFDGSSVTVHGTTKSYEGRHFCPECGSSLFPITDGEIEIHLGSFDEPNQFKPDYELWTKRRENWLPDFCNFTAYEMNREDK